MSTVGIMTIEKLHSLSRGVLLSVDLFSQEQSFTHVARCKALSYAPILEKGREANPSEGNRMEKLLLNF